MECIFSETYTKKDFTKTWVPWEYEDCEFVGCDFSDVDLSYSRFLSCRMIGCNLSNVKTLETGMQEVSFSDCKILGVHFQKCNNFLFEVTFEKCILDFSVFSGLSLTKSIFREWKLHGVDFSWADLSWVSLWLCDLKGAIFSRTILTGTDFRSAVNYQIDAEENTISGAKFSLSGTPGLLLKYDIIIE